MKKRGDALRFVAVSATVRGSSVGSNSSQVPNIDDVARWIGSKEHIKSQEHDEENQPMPRVEYDDIEQMPKARVFKVGFCCVRLTDSLATNTALSPSRCTPSVSMHLTSLRLAAG